MTDEESKPKVLKGEEALALAREGKEAWNAWAEDNLEVAVDFSDHDFRDCPISFEEFIFPGETWFSNCIFDRAEFRYAQFNGETWFNGVRFISVAWFVGANFSGGNAWFVQAQFSEAWFDDAVFGGGDVLFTFANFHQGAFFSKTVFSRDVVFRNALFKKNVVFQNAIFRNIADFSSSVFESAVILDGACFDVVPDFRQTIIRAHFTLHRVLIQYRESIAPKRVLFKKAYSASDSDKYRRLKELAIASKDHDLEQDFFASELKAKRFYETHEAALVWSYLYEWFSDFGRSVYRPLVSLYATVVAFGFIYWLAALSSVGGGDKSLDNGLKLSAAVLVPFVAAARTSYGEAKTALFGAHAGLWLDVLVIGEGILGLAFVFLIGLALRNRFRI